MTTKLCAVSFSDWLRANGYQSHSKTSDCLVCAGWAENEIKEFWNSIVTDFIKETGGISMAGKVYWQDLEVLRINEKYVDGYGWITEDEYQAIMYNPKNPQTQLWSKIRQYNVQYRTPDGRTGQMDIAYDSFWEHRRFVPAQEMSKEAEL